LRKTPETVPRILPRTVPRTAPSSGLGGWSFLPVSRITPKEVLMTFLSLADCCRHLSIDPKTLRRWLVQAHLPVQRHPTDGRKTALSEAHLRRLATLHHRWLSALPEAAPSPL